MDYIELKFKLEDPEAYRKDILIDALANVGFDTFEEHDEGFSAYVVKENFEQTAMELALEPFADFDFAYEINNVKSENWNAVWESNFEPIHIKDQVYVRATFHNPKPDFPYEIVIDPKMSFGTGHHQTTALMMEYLLEADLQDKELLDMGCGTAILAILAAKLGAKSLVAIDYDPVCYESTLENAELNGIDKLTAYCGSKEAIPNQKYDVILANINRNILLDQMESYSGVLKTKGEIYFSGFYEEPDLGIIKAAAENLGMQYVNHKKKDAWVAAKFIKK
ncbi:ribosomal protein L11 methyltransferase [Pelobium manganitolerans]|uniref:Ribosomal protein L11 methyltransferase n=1 Tax=Pelobium manganitolerans TaxID=1842495 RepID=A0A419S5Q1_9SPHI|nr:50S ribosomal protein L11 methyltransferase [Pelobium manganitolerans]RKD16174.1 ribosomal protein L11 methyltransferase [Pelobium manganitolerans]